MRAVEDLNEEITAELVDVAFKLKAAIEDYDFKALAGLFTAEPSICIEGRFVGLDDFEARLREFASEGREQLMFDISRIVNVDLDPDTGLAYLDTDVESAWINARLWEEERTYGTLNLTLVRERLKTSKKRVPASDAKKQTTASAKPVGVAEPEPTAVATEPSEGIRAASTTTRDPWKIKGLNYQSRTDDSDLGTSVAGLHESGRTHEPSGWGLGLESIYGVIQFWL